MDSLLLHNGRETSRIAFGCGGLGGATGWTASRSLLVAAWDAGIRHFDVAPSYGFGEAEQFLGRAFREFGPSATVTTKVGIGRGTRPGIWGQALREAARTGLGLMPGLRRKLGERLRAAVPRAQFDAAGVRTSIEESLRALGRDHIDILLLHEAVVEDIGPSLLELLVQLQGEGKIGAAGVGSRAVSLAGMTWPLPFPLVMAQSEWRLDGGHFPAPDLMAMNRHGAFRSLPQLAAILAENPAFASQLAERTGINCADPHGGAGLLLGLALAEAPGGLVIAQSRDVRRVVMLAGARALDDAPAILAEFRGQM